VASLTAIFVLNTLLAPSSRAATLTVSPVRGIFHPRARSKVADQRRSGIDTDAIDKGIKFDVTRSVTAATLIAPPFVVTSPPRLTAPPVVLNPPGAASGVGTTSVPEPYATVRPPATDTAPSVGTVVALSDTSLRTPVVVSDTGPPDPSDSERSWSVDAANLRCH
jgi:hypothetical protein